MLEMTPSVPASRIVRAPSALPSVVALVLAYLLGAGCAVTGESPVSQGARVSGGEEDAGSAPTPDAGSSPAGETPGPGRQLDARSLSRCAALIVYGQRQSPEDALAVCKVMSSTALGCLAGAVDPALDDEGAIDSDILDAALQQCVPQLVHACQFPTCRTIANRRTCKDFFADAGGYSREVALTFCDGLPEADLTCLANQLSGFAPGDADAKSLQTILGWCVSDGGEQCESAVCDGARFEDCRSYFLDTGQQSRAGDFDDVEAFCLAMAPSELGCLVGTLEEVAVPEDRALLAPFAEVVDQCLSGDPLLCEGAPTCATVRDLSLCVDILGPRYAERRELDACLHFRNSGILSCMVETLTELGVTGFIREHIPELAAGCAAGAGAP